MKVLITGFGPFANIEQNPSQRVVDELAQQMAADGDIQLLTEILPVEYDAAGARIEAMIRRNLPDLVLSIGAAAGSKQLSLERVALNLDDCALPDNAGQRRQGEPIVPDAPAAYFCTLPLSALRDQMEEQDIPAAISNHAGTFVCNHVFYRVAHLVHTTQLPIRHGFVHVPLLGSEGTQSDAPMSLSQAVQGIKLILDNLCSIWTQDAEENDQHDQ